MFNLITGIIVAGVGLLDIAVWGRTGDKPCLIWGLVCLGLGFLNVCIYLAGVN